MHLKGKARKAAYTLGDDVLTSKDGVNKLLKKLESTYHPDAGRKRFQIYDEMRKLIRSSGQSIHDFILDYDHLFYRFKTQDFHLDETTSAYELLESCNLGESKREIIMSALTGDFTYESMKETILRICHNDTSTSTSSDPIFYSNNQDTSQPTLQGSSNFFKNPMPRGRPRSLSSGTNKRKREWSPVRYRHSGSSSRWPSDKYRKYEHTRDNRSSSSGRINPTGTDGKITTCRICRSIAHWARACPDKDNLALKYQTEQRDEKDKNNFSMFVGCTSSEKEKSMANLVKESKDHAILDSGCITTVCGETWLKSYMTGLPKGYTSKIKIRSSEETFTFGDGKAITSNRKIQLPCWINGIQGTFTTDVVNNNIPLLLSKNSMQAINLELKFKNNMATVLENNIPIKLKTTSSGHLALPISL